jgi:hypothetical protein
MAKSTVSRQTSNKAGVTSLAKKQDSTRHGFATQPAARKVAGASGLEGRGQHRQSSASTRKRGKAAALRGLKTTS